ATGGTFDSDVTISPRLTFTQEGTSTAVTLDQSTIHFTTSGASWTHQPGAGPPPPLGRLVDPSARRRRPDLHDRLGAGRHRRRRRGGHHGAADLELRGGLGHGGPGRPADA